MYRDLQKGGPIEADQIIGDLLARAERTRADTAFGGHLYPSLDLSEQAVVVKVIGAVRPTAAFALLMCDIR